MVSTGLFIKSLPISGIVLKRPGVGENTGTNNDKFISVKFCLSRIFKDYII